MALFQVLRLEYDDDGLAVIDKVNAALAPHGLHFEDDCLPHDGFCLLTLKPVVKLQCGEGAPLTEGSPSGTVQGTQGEDP
jgi:hypothetical protein